MIQLTWLRFGFWLPSLMKPKSQAMAPASCVFMKVMATTLAFRCYMVETELTGSPTAMLSRAILFVPACRLAAPVYVNFLFSLVPYADPAIRR